MSEKNLSDPVTLPCGLVLRNRLVKAAMAEALGGSSNIPNAHLTTAYSQWSSGSWGALITGNVLVDRHYLAGPSDVCIDSPAHFESNLSAWKSYADAGQADGTPTIVQICHAGRQSPLGAGTRGVTTKNLAPSAVPINIGDGWIASGARSVLFGTPKEMTKQEIEDVVERFVVAAKGVEKAGFSGVEIHAAHGYLLSTFLTPNTNLRNDEYGGSPEKRTKIVIDIINCIRAAIPRPFCIGIKLNSVDASSSSLEDSLTQIRLLAATGIDFLEVSGGSYEDPRMVGASIDAPSESTRAREAYFLDYAEHIRKEFPELLLMVTGGFRTRAGMRDAVRKGACDLVGIGRPALVEPRLPVRLLDEKVPDEEATLVLKSVSPGFLGKWVPVKVLGAGIEMQYWYKQMALMGQGKPTIAP